jgi:hypothetical protein
MTVTAVSSGKIRPGHTITGTGVTLGTIVVSQVSGTTNGIGDYTVSISQTVTSRALTAVTNEFDGVPNGTLFKDIDNTVGSGSTIFPAANFCEALNIGGYTDWYLPSRYELEIAYFNLKPSTTVNVTNRGSNIYSVPRRNSNYTLSFPRQTDLTTFNTTAEAFITDEPYHHWLSTEGNLNSGWSLFFGNGTQGAAKTNTYPVRAFRKIAF